MADEVFLAPCPHKPPGRPGWRDNRILPPISNSCKVRPVSGGRTVGAPRGGKAEVGLCVSDRRDE
jgi:hypothetical protein